MPRLTSCLLAVLCLLSANSTGALAASWPQGAGTPTGAELQSPSVASTIQANATKEKKRLKEIEKLQAEIESLRLQNEALDVQTRRWSAWLGAIGGVTGAMLTFVIGFLGWRLNRLQDTRTKKEEHLALRKLEQDRHLERGKQNLKLYEGLGHDNPRVQFAALAHASVLLERLTTYRDKTKRRQDQRPADHGRREG